MNAVINFDPEFETKNEDFFRARTLQNQFGALASRCNIEYLNNDLRGNQYRQPKGVTQNFNEDEVIRWLRNGWNTERLLRANRENLEGDALRYSLQWAFPQAYYSSFALVLAFFKTVGYPQESHTGLIKYVGELMKGGYYPPRIGFIANGGKNRIYHNINNGELPSPMHYDAADESCVDTHVCHFLNATRRADLEAKKLSIKLRTKTGAIKKNFSVEDWDNVSNNLGLTSIISLMYRKRIKANYQDIDTLISEHLRADILYDDLIVVVSALNFVHEYFICRALREVICERVWSSAKYETYTFVNDRYRLFDY